MTAPRVKICGLTRLEDARRAADLGAWALGLIFYPESPRRCDPDAAAEIAGALRRRAEIVGVFVNAPLDEVALIADQAALTMLQLHGDEGPAYAGEAARRTGAKVIKAARVRSGADVQALASFHTDFHMLDNHAPGMWGGTGEPFDWRLVRSRRSRTPLILSGGLEAGNVASAVAATHPFAVDVSSGVESAPGVKDHDKLEAFFAAARNGAEAGVS